MVQREEEGDKERSTQNINLEKNGHLRGVGQSQPFMTFQTHKSTLVQDVWWNSDLPHTQNGLGLVCIGSVKIFRDRLYNIVTATMWQRSS